MNTLGETAAEILAWLARHEPASALDVGRACGIERASVRGRLIALERQGFIAGRLNGEVPAKRIYSVTDHGRQSVPLRC